jgi:glucose-1-phosphate thymidylyltransferase
VKAVILAAGYATRLYPLTLDRPKALLPVGGKPMLDHLREQLERVEGLDEMYVVTNSKFADAFREWAAGRSGLPLRIREEGLDDDLLVLAGDNLFSESIAPFPVFALEKGGPALGVYDVGDLETIRRYSVIELDEDDRVTRLEEKPEQPRSTLAGIALYFYPRSALRYVREYLEEGNNPDQPGRLVQWLYPGTGVYGWRVPGRWFDVGSKETLAEADQAFTGRG